MSHQLTHTQRVARDTFLKYERYTVFQRFLRYVDIGAPDECWEWQGHLGHFDYGSFKWRRKHCANAHVASYELFIGDRRGLQVHHSCDNPPCVNPNHLWLGTQLENIHDMMDKGREDMYYPRHGSKNANSKLTEREVKKIRNLHKTGEYNYPRLARKFDVTISMIEKIVNRKNWTEI